MVSKLIEYVAVPFVIMHATQSILHYPIQSGNLTFIHN